MIRPKASRGNHDLELKKCCFWLQEALLPVYTSFCKDKAEFIQAIKPIEVNEAFIKKVCAYSRRIFCLRFYDLSKQFSPPASRIRPFWAHLHVSMRDGVNIHPIFGQTER